jgi:alpha-ribazole phosphatase
MRASTTIDLLRHGEPRGGPRYRGRTDDPLTGRGWLQMYRALETARPWDGIVSSPLRRCRDFAEQLVARLSLPLALDDGLREMDFGRWEGLTAAQLLRREPHALRRFWHDPVAHPPPDGEPLPAFRQQVIQAWARLVVGHRGQHLLLITHGGWIRVLLHHVLGTPLQQLHAIDVPYACLSRIRVQQREGGLSAHLAFHGGTP